MRFPQHAQLTTLAKTIHGFSEVDNSLERSGSIDCDVDGLSTCLQGVDLRAMTPYGCFCRAVNVLPRCQPPKLSEKLIVTATRDEEPSRDGLEDRSMKLQSRDCG